MGYDANEIKQSISMLDLAHLYGLEPSRSGLILCPFHDDKNPSLKLYAEPGKGFYCFACGTGGSVIDFVMKYESISFPEAVKKLGEHLGLSGTDRLAFKRRQNKRDEERRYYESVLDQYRVLMAIRRQNIQEMTPELEWALKNEMSIKLELGRLEGDVYRYVNIV